MCLLLITEVIKRTKQFREMFQICLATSQCNVNREMCGYTEESNTRIENVLDLCGKLRVDDGRRSDRESGRSKFLFLTKLGHSDRSTRCIF